jgi:hypothetical protein
LSEMEDLELSGLRSSDPGDIGPLGRGTRVVMGLRACLAVRVAFILLSSAELTKTLFGVPFGLGWGTEEYRAASLGGTGGGDSLSGVVG